MKSYLVPGKTEKLLFSTCFIEIISTYAFALMEGAGVFFSDYSKYGRTLKSQC